MEGLLAGIDHVTVYLDDILLTGLSEDQHLRTLDLVLFQPEGAGLQLKKYKCVLMALCQPLAVQEHLSSRQPGLGTR